MAVKPLNMAVRTDGKRARTDEWQPPAAEGGDVEMKPEKGGGKGSGTKGGKGSKGGRKGPVEGCWECQGDHYYSECPHLRFSKPSWNRMKPELYPQLAWTKLYGAIQDSWKGKGKGKNGQGGKSGFKGGGKGGKGKSQGKGISAVNVWNQQPLNSMQSDDSQCCTEYSVWPEPIQEQWQQGCMMNLTKRQQEDQDQEHEEEQQHKAAAADEFIENKRKGRTSRFKLTSEFNEALHKGKSFEHNNRFGVLTPADEVKECQHAWKHSRNKSFECCKTDCVSPSRSGVAGMLRCRESTVHKKNKTSQPCLMKREVSIGGGAEHDIAMLAQKIRELNLLTRETKNDLSAITGNGGWRRFSLAVDSGACASVADPSSLDGFEVKETAESRAGEQFSAASGDAIPNLGAMVVPIWTQEETMRLMNLTAAPVVKPLLSVRQLCRRKHLVIFDEDGGYILNKVTGEINALREEGGNYMLDCWIRPPTDEATQTPFTRQP